MLNSKDVLDTIKELSIVAGEEILKLFNKDISPEYKEDNSPVTEADKMPMILLSVELKKNFRIWEFWLKNHLMTYQGWKRDIAF